MSEVIFKFQKVYDKNRSKKFIKEIDENPTIIKKGKKINLREFINEGFESSDLMTNLKKFGNAERIRKESAFLMLDDMLLESDFRNLLDIQTKGKEAYKNIAAIDRRNLSEKEFLKEYDNYKNQKDKNINKTGEKENVESSSE